MAVQVEFLKLLSYFSGLSPAELDAIKRHVFEKTLAKGEMAVVEGEAASELYFVADGEVKVFKTSADGKEQILCLVHPGDSFNDVPVSASGRNIAGALAMSDVTLYGLRKIDMESMLKTYPRVTLNTVSVLSKRVEQLTLLVEDLSFRHVTSRVAKILLEHVSDGANPKSRLTQQDMAAMAGTAREMVGRSLKALEADGTIRMERHRIIIANPRALRETAGIA